MFDYRAIFDANPDAVIIMDAKGGILDANQSALQRYGYSLEKLTQMNISDLSVKSMKSKVLPLLQESIESRKQFELLHRCQDGSVFPVEIHTHSIINKGESAILASMRDITELSAIQAVLHVQKQVLEMIAVGAPLQETLTVLIRQIEAQAPKMLGSILLLDEDGIHVRHGAAPSLPSAFVAAVDGQPIGPCAGSCGTAAYRKQSVFVEDIATDPLWETYKEAALQQGLHACWSTPIFNAKRQVLGTFAMYYREPGLPQIEHLKLIETTTHLASIAINHHQAEVSLRESEDRFRKVFEEGGLGIAMAHATDPHFISVNSAFCEMLGYTEEELKQLSVADVTHPDDLANDKEAFDGLMEGRIQKHSAEKRYLKKDGEVVWGMRTLTKIYSSNSDSFDVLAMIADINERKLREVELRKLSLAVEQSPNSIFITDLYAIIEYVNDSFLKMTGYTRNEVIGKNPRILQSGKIPKSTYDDMWAHLTHGEVWRGELINKRKDGSEYVELAMISPVRQADGKITHYLAIKEDISEQKKTKERIEKLAHFDQLTGLPNRSQLDFRFNYALSLAQRSGGAIAVLFLDLDHFKNVNDTLGHTIGDKLLMEVAKRIKSVLRDEDTVSRQGGDEFILILNATDLDGAVCVASKLIETISQSCKVGKYELSTTPSIGIAIYPKDGLDLETLSKNADAAMYHAKQSGRNNYSIYTPEMQLHSARTLQLANALRYALERNEFQLHYQPQFSIHSENIVGVEALLRWRHPVFGEIPPIEFIPILEDSGQIVSVGEWILHTSAKQMKDWIDSGLKPIVMAVNLSSVQLRQADIANQITQILREVKLPHQYIELELTEAVAMSDPLTAIKVMDKFHESGIRMSIDDFGTGYSSLSYLKKFNVHKIKIDQSFVRDITDDPDDKAIVGAIINMASSLGIKTIAEGVESFGQLEFLRTQGCDEVQGFYFSKPLTSEEFETFVKQYNTSAIT